MQVISVQGIDKVSARFHSLQIATALKSGIRKSIFALEVRAKKETPVGVSGFLRNGYREIFDGLRGELINTKEYAQFVHEGRSPGKMPPIGPIALWVKRKGIPIPAFVIARSIAKKGTKANPFLKRSVDIEERNIRAILQGEVRTLISQSKK